MTDHPAPAPADDRVPAAVLWDMDGTLVDTEPIWQESQEQLTDEHGVTWTHEDGLSLVGSGLERSGEILRAKGVDLGVEEIIQYMTSFVVERLEHDDLPWRPGARELVEELHRRGIPTALVTMSRRRMAMTAADALGDDGFRVVVAGDDVEHAKPHPEAYLRAAELLGVDAADCIAIEDSATGLASAIASGAVTVGVEHIVPLADLAGDVHLHSLSGVDVDRLLELTAPVFAARAEGRSGSTTIGRSGGTGAAADAAPAPETAR